MEPVDLTLDRFTSSADDEASFRKLLKRYLLDQKAYISVLKRADTNVDAEFSDEELRIGIFLLLQRLVTRHGTNQVKNEQRLIECFPEVINPDADGNLSEAVFIEAFADTVLALRAKHLHHNITLDDYLIHIRESVNYFLNIVSGRQEDGKFFRFIIDFVSAPYQAFSSLFNRGRCIKMFELPFALLILLVQIAEVLGFVSLHLYFNSDYDNRQVSVLEAILPIGLIGLIALDILLGLLVYELKADQLFQKNLARIALHIMWHHITPLATADYGTPQGRVHKHEHKVKSLGVQLGSFNQEKHDELHETDDGEINLRNSVFDYVERNPIQSIIISFFVALVHCLIPGVCRLLKGELFWGPNWNSRFITSIHVLAAFPNLFSICMKLQSAQYQYRRSEVWLERIGALSSSRLARLRKFPLYLDLAVPMNVDFWVKIRNFARDAAEQQWLAIVGLTLATDIAYFVVIFVRVLFYKSGFDIDNILALYDGILFAVFIMWTLSTIVNVNSQIQDHLHLLGSVRYEFAMDLAGAYSPEPVSPPITAQQPLLPSGSATIIHINPSSSSSSSSSLSSSLSSSPPGLEVSDEKRSSISVNTPPTPRFVKLPTQGSELRLRGYRTFGQNMTKSFRHFPSSIKHKSEESKEYNLEVTPQNSLLALDTALYHMRYFDRLVTLAGIVIDKNLFLQMGAVMVTGAASGVSKLVSNLI